MIYDIKLIFSSLIGHYGVSRQEILSWSQQEFFDKLWGLDKESPFMFTVGARGMDVKELESMPDNVKKSISDFKIFREEVLLMGIHKKYQDPDDALYLRMAMSDLKNGRPDGQPISKTVYEIYLDKVRREKDEQ